MENSIIEHLLGKSLTKYSEKDYSLFVDENQTLCSLSHLDKDVFFNKRIAKIEKKIRKTLVGNIWLKRKAPDMFSDHFIPVILFETSRVVNYEVDWARQFNEREVENFFDEFFKLIFQRHQLQQLNGSIPIKTSQIANETNSKINDRPVSNLLEADLICPLEIIKESYKYFNELDFFKCKISLTNYLACFDRNKLTTPLQFKYTKKVRFAYFLVKLMEYIEGKEKYENLTGVLMERRFGIITFANYKRRATKETVPEQAFVNYIKVILT